MFNKHPDLFALLGVGTATAALFSWIELIRRLQVALADHSIAVIKGGEYGLYAVLVAIAFTYAGFAKKVSGQIAFMAVSLAMLIAAIAFNLTF